MDEVEKRLEVPGRILRCSFVILVLSTASVEMNIIYNGLTPSKSLSPPIQSIPLAIGFIVLVDEIVKNVVFNLEKLRAGRRSRHEWPDGESDSGEESFAERSRYY